jgi:hypothetical protein
MNEELVSLAKRFLESAPQANISNPDLAGFGGEIGFLCSACAARISARGYGLLKTCGATVPIWVEQRHDCCAVCGRN